MPLNALDARVAALALTCMLQGCGPGVAEETQRLSNTLRAPSQAAFPDVANALQLRCATLDCHGQVGRNLRLYGYGGLRLSKTETPMGNPTTDLEFDAAYDSLVGLEPELVSGVVALEIDPNQLTLVRKIRGIEHHKGGQLVAKGDALDRCIVLWLTDKSDPAPCNEVIDTPRPGTK